MACCGTPTQIALRVLVMLLFAAVAVALSKDVGTAATILGVAAIISPFVLGGATVVRASSSQYWWLPMLQLLAVEVPLSLAMMYHLSLVFSALYASHWLLISWGLLGSLSAFVFVWRSLAVEIKVELSEVAAPQPLTLDEAGQQVVPLDGKRQDTDATDQPLPDAADNAAVVSLLGLPVPTSAATYIPEFFVIAPESRSAVTTWIRAHLVPEGTPALAFGMTLLLVHHLYWMVYILSESGWSSIFASVLSVPVASLLLLLGFCCWNMSAKLPPPLATGWSIVSTRVLLPLVLALVLLLAFGLLFSLSTSAVRGDMPPDQMLFTTCSAIRWDTEYDGDRQYQRLNQQREHIRHSLAQRSISGTASRGCDCKPARESSYSLEFVRDTWAESSLRRKSVPELLAIGRVHDLSGLCRIVCSQLL